MGDWHSPAGVAGWAGADDGRDGTGGGSWRGCSLPLSAATAPLGAVAQQYKCPPSAAPPGAHARWEAQAAASRGEGPYGGYPPPPRHAVDVWYPPPSLSSPSPTSVTSWSQRSADDEARGQLTGWYTSGCTPPPVAVDRHWERSRSRGRHDTGPHAPSDAVTTPAGTPPRASPHRDHRGRQTRHSPAGEDGCGGGGSGKSRDRERSRPRSRSASRGRRESHPADTAHPRHRRARSTADARYLSRLVDSPLEGRQLTPRTGGDNSGRPGGGHRHARQLYPLQWEGGGDDRRRVAADTADDDRGRRPGAVAGGGHSRRAPSCGRSDERGGLRGGASSAADAAAAVAAAADAVPRWMERRAAEGRVTALYRAPAGEHVAAARHVAGSRRGAHRRGGGSTGGGGSYGDRADQHAGHPARTLGSGVTAKAAADTSSEALRIVAGMRRARSTAALSAECPPPPQRVGANPCDDERWGAARGRVAGGGDPFRRASTPGPRPAVERPWREEAQPVRRSIEAFPYAPTGRGGVCRAVLIGATYRFDRDASKLLPGPDRDVVAVRRLLGDYWGVPDTRVTILTDGPAVARAGLAVGGKPSRAAILGACRAVVDASFTGDTIFFFFSGHGSRARDTAGDEVDGWDNTIVPTDWATPEGSSPITDDLLYRVLVKDLPPGVRLFSIFDCCHSSNVLGLQGQFFSSDGPADPPTPRVAVPPEALMEEGWRAGVAGGMRSIAGSIASSGDADADDRTRGALSVPDILIRSVRAAMEALAVSAVTHPPTLGVAWCLAACGATATSTNARGTVGAHGALTDAFIRTVRRAAERGGRAGGAMVGGRRRAPPALTYWDLRRGIAAELNAQGLTQVPVLSASAPEARLGECLEL